jgi:glycosyltransferase involved in cell wall biosynthesis
VNKLKLAVFNTQPPHLYFGGVERRIIETAKRLLGEVDATVYCGTKKGFRKPTRMDGVWLVPCFSTNSLFPVDNWFFNQTLSRNVNSIKADVYEAHAVSGYGFLKALRKQPCRKPFVQTVHGVLADEYVQAQRSGALSFREKLANLLMWRLSKLEGESARNADLVVAVSKYSSEKIVQFYDVEESKIRVVPNGVDIQRFKPADDCAKVKRQLGMGDKQCLLFVGRLIPRKGLHFLAEAAKRIVEERAETMFLIVGEGPVKNPMISHLKQAGLSDNFVFLGDASEDLLPSLYRCADVFAFPSIQEGLGIALLEAQATATPVVAFNQGGVREAVKHEKTGLLVEPDSDELADAILRLLSDQGLRERMGEEGRSFVSDNFSWKTCAERMLQVYHEAISANT